MAENSSSQRVTIDLYADIICPWCYIGKKRLETALAERPNIEFTINWRAFLLNPSMPPAGMDRQAYLAAKFGHAASAIYGRIAMAGLDAGISFAFSRIDRTPDTKPLHKLLIGAGKDSWALSEAFIRPIFSMGGISRTAMCRQIFLPKWERHPSMMIFRKMINPKADLSRIWQTAMHLA